MTPLQRVLAALAGAAFAAIIPLAWAMSFGVTSPFITWGIPAIGAAAGAVFGDRGTRVVLRLVGAGA